MIELEPGPEKPSRTFLVHTSAPWSPRVESWGERADRMRQDMNVFIAQLAWLSS